MSTPQATPPVDPAAPKQAPTNPGAATKSPAAAPGGAKTKQSKSPAAKTPATPADAKAPAATDAKKAPAASEGKKAPAASEGKKAPAAADGSKKAPASPEGKTKSTKAPADAGGKGPKAPATEGDAKAPAPAGSKSPTAGGTKSPQPGTGKSKGTKSPAGSGAKSPAPGGKSPAPNAGAKSAEPAAEVEPAAPASAGGKAPSSAASKAPTPAGSKSPTPVVGPPSEVAAAPPTESSAAPGTAGATVAPSSQPPVPPASSAAGASDVTNSRINNSEVEPQYSPIPRVNSTMGNQSMIDVMPQNSSPNRNRARAGSGRAPPPKKAMGPLTFDPRSGLPLIEIPRDRQHAFAHLGNDMLLHIFMEVERISSRGSPLRRVLFVTDQTLFLCEENGGVLRCVQVSKIDQVNLSTDNSNSMALTIQSEYDIILKLERRQLRDDLVVVLRAVYRRMTDEELNVRMVKEIRANQYKLERPPGFQLVRIPQRSKAHLAKALEAIEAQEDERRQAVETVQSQLNEVHANELENKKTEAASVRAKLDEANTRLRQQQEELERLRVAYSKCKKRVEEIDAQMGPNGEVPNNKDDKIKELNEIVEKLTMSVAKTNEERARLEAKKRQGDFEEREPDELDVEQNRFRGRSLHQQGLVEVLQRQLLEKKRELVELQAKQIDVQRLNLELKGKEDHLKELEQLVQLPPDPTMLYSNVPGSSVTEMLDKVNSTYSPSRGFVNAPGLTGVHIDPTLAIDQAGVVVNRRVEVDEDGEAVHTGGIPQGRVNIPVGSPEYRLPADEKDFDKDPRTNLPLVDIPTMHEEAFADLKGTIIHFFAVGSKLNKRGRPQNRVMVCSDQTLYQCNTSGHINRCIWITSIRQVILDQTSIALIVDGKNEYDVAFSFDKPQMVEQLANVLAKVNQFLKRDPPMQTSRVDRISIADLKLEKPATYEFKLHPLRRKRDLYRTLVQISKSTAEERAKLHQASDQQTLEIINRLKEEMKPEINLRREREFAVLRQQLLLLDASVREKQLEVRNLRRTMAEHKCTIDPKKIVQYASETREEEGYWIPTDPVIMECDHEILHIQFHDNFVITSHANGFLHVWDINTAEPFRTLRHNGHTARVQAFYFDGKECISGGFDSSIRRWNVIEGICTKVVHNAHHGHVTVVKFDQLHLMSGGADGVIHVWDISTLKHEKALRGHKTTVTAFSFSRNTLASSEWGWIFVWDIDKAIVVKALRDDNGGITTLDLHGMTLVTGGTGGVVTVWNLHTGEGEQLDGHTDDVHCVQLQQHFCITSSADCTIRMWNVKEMSSLGIFHNSFPIECKKFHFLKNRFVVGEGRTIKVWTR